MRRPEPGLRCVTGTVILAASASGPTASTTVGYGFDPAGFRRSRTVGSQTTRFLLGGLIETTTAGTITGFDVDGPAGDLAHYTTAPSSAVNPTYVYYSGHGDLAAEADQTGTRTRLLRLDPWGQPLAAPGGSDLQELYTGRWDKKHDQVTSLIEMGVRPYDPMLGRFLSPDSVDGGSCSEYDYACQDPVNAFDLSGLALDEGTGGRPCLRVYKSCRKRVRTPVVPPLPRPAPKLPPSSLIPSVRPAPERPSLIKDIKTLYDTGKAAASCIAAGGSTNLVVKVSQTYVEHYGGKLPYVGRYIRPIATSGRYALVAGMCVGAAAKTSAK